MVQPSVLARDSRSETGRRAAYSGCTPVSRIAPRHLPASAVMCSAKAWGVEPMASAPEAPPGPCGTIIDAGIGAGQSGQGRGGRRQPSSGAASVAGGKARSVRMPRHRNHRALPRFLPHPWGTHEDARAGIGSAGDDGTGSRSGTARRRSCGRSALSGARGGCRKLSAIRQVVERQAPRASSSRVELPGGPENPQKQ